MKKVKILIPAYNSEKTIGDTLQSIINQTYTNIDILVVDNCSTDNTIEVVKSFTDPRVHYVSNATNLGNYGNFDKCIQLADYDYTAIFHSDDIYLSTIIEEQVSILNHDETVGAVFTEAEKMNSNQQAIGHIKTPFFSGGNTKNGVIYFNFEQLLKAIIHHNCFLMCPSAMVRSDIYKKEINRTRTEIFGAAADIDVWLRVSMKWKTAVIKKELMKYRISTSQHTYRINQKRLIRSEYALIANYYRSNHKNILKDSNLAIKREKIIDLIIRLAAAEKSSRNYFNYKKIIFYSFLDLRLFTSLRWWKYFIIFFIILFRR